MRITWHQRERIGHPASLWAVMMAALLVTMLPLPAAAAAAEGKRVAFVVGIGTYDQLPHQQLTNSLNDAEGVSQKLADIGFQVEKAINLSRSDFGDRWENVLNRLTEEDTFVLYFSGHGVQIDGLNYLLPRDVRYVAPNQRKRLTRDAISLTELLTDLSSGDQHHPKRSVVILDACRIDPFSPQSAKSTATRGGLANLKDPKPSVPISVGHFASLQLE